MREFERQFKIAFSEDEKMSIIVHVAPKELTATEHFQTLRRFGYNKIRDYIEQYLVNKNLWKRPQGSQFGLTKMANKMDDDG